MLQVVNLTKIYKTKQGAEVRALNNVSIQFPEKGMVFLLGKSGSGKSTLLNVCGGLDVPTSGEIIVKGRSSKDFSESDFDSYRNTYIGFIFQEYNILNEFSVEDNIALALELQGKPKNKAAIGALLEAVDMKGFAKRKPNTLSGGQKQRIAIARALVKSPEIIMADEPTGALDSNTGKQVLETLKMLSKDKLVIVVSHDREFAEQYGDRIIELKDGKVISDISKTLLEQLPVTENISAFDDILYIKQGSELNEGDFNKIKVFLKNTDSDLIIASNEKDVKNFKKISRINAGGKKEVFRNTDKSNIKTKKYSEKDSYFINSKLPLKHAIKIGLSSLRNKPIRLLLTIILCTVAFGLFGLLSTLSFYNSEAMLKQTLYDGGNAVIRANKTYGATMKWYFNGELDSEFETSYHTCFNENDLKELQEQFGNDVFGGVPTEASLNIHSSSLDYWINRIETFAFLPQSNSLRNKITGSYPSNDNEIVVSTYVADMFTNCGIYSADGKLLELDSASDIIGETIAVGNHNYKVVGIFDIGEIPEKYDELKKADEAPSKLENDFYSMLSDGLYLVAYVSESRLEAIAEEYTPYSEDSSANHSVSVSLGSVDLPDYSNCTYISYSDGSKNTIITPIASEINALGDNEVIISDEFYYVLLMEYISSKYSTSESADTQYILQINNLLNELQAGGIWIRDDNTGNDVLNKFTEEEMINKKNQLISLVKDNNISPTLSLKLYNQDENLFIGELLEYTVVGVCNLSTGNNYNYRIILSDSETERLWNEQKKKLEFYSEVFTSYIPDPTAIYDVIFLPYDGSSEQTDLYWEMYNDKKYDDDGTRLYLPGAFIDNVRSVDYIIEDMSQIFLYVGIAFAVFAVLLFSNFISVSISQKKREIGILRAVGARSFDVFKIFFSESFFISVLCFVLSAIGCLIACNLINAELSSTIGVSLLVFGPLSFIVLLAIAFLTSFVSTFLPVYNAAKKKPVDSIHSI